MDTGRSEYTEVEQRLALRRMQSAFRAVRRPARRAAVTPSQELVGSRLVEPRDDTYEAGMFQECGLLP